MKSTVLILADGRRVDISGMDPHDACNLLESQQIGPADIASVEHRTIPETYRGERLADLTAFYAETKLPPLGHWVEYLAWKAGR